MKINDLPRGIDGGKWNSGHVQGIAVDVKKGFVYYSFTTVLAKTDLLGNLIGYAGGLVGHLGCIDINPEDGKVYRCARTGEASGGKVTLQYLPHELIGQYFMAVSDNAE